MNAAYCLDCDSSLKISDHTRVGDIIECPECESEFELVSLNPPELEWLYDDEWEEEEEEEEEEEGSWSWMVSKRHRSNSDDHERSNRRDKYQRDNYDF